MIDCEEDYGLLDDIVSAIDGAGGKAYPMLGFAIVPLSPQAGPVDATGAIEALPGVTDVRLMLRGRYVYPTDTSIASRISDVFLEVALILGVAGCGGGDDEDLVPTFEQPSIPDKNYVQNLAIVSETLLMASGGALTWPFPRNCPRA